MFWEHQFKSNALIFKRNKINNQNWISVEQYTAIGIKRIKYLIGASETETYLFILYLILNITLCVCKQY